MHLLQFALVPAGNLGLSALVAKRADLRLGWKEGSASIWTDWRTALGAAGIAGHLFGGGMVKAASSTLGVISLGNLAATEPIRRAALARAQATVAQQGQIAQQAQRLLSPPIASPAAAPQAVRGFYGVY